MGVHVNVLLVDSELQTPEPTYMALEEGQQGVINRDLELIHNSHDRSVEYSKRIIVKCFETIQMAML